MMLLSDDELSVLNCIAKVEAEQNRPARFEHANARTAQRLDELALVRAWSEGPLTRAVCRQEGYEELRLRGLAR